MKKLIILFLMMFIFAACSSNEESSSTSDSTKTAEKFSEEIEEPIVLKYNYKEGQKFAYRLTSISESLQKIEADTTINTDIKQTVNYELGLTVKSINADGDSNIEIVVNAVSLNAEMNGDITEYDSKVSPEIGTDNSIIDYRVLLNKPFNLKINNIGEITGVENISKIVDAFVDHQFKDQPLKPEQKNDVEERLKTGMIMPFAQQLFKVLPNKEVNKDSTWTRNYSSPFAVFQTDNTITFEVIGFNNDENSLMIDMELVSIPTGDTEATENGVNYKFDVPVINGTGSIDFDYANSVINKSKTITNISIAMSMEGKTADNKSSIVKRTDKTKNINIVEKI